MESVYAPQKTVSEDWEVEVSGEEGWIGVVEWWGGAENGVLGV